VDNTYCTVKSGSDDLEDFHSLRRKIERGFNNSTSMRACTDLINFDSSVKTVKLTSPLSINNSKDLDCTISGHPLCQDQWAFVISGGEGDSKITLDVTAVGAGSCAVQLKSNKVKLNNIEIIATEEQIAADKILCDEGEENDTTGVTTRGAPGATPTPSPTPTAQPTESPTPTESPRPSPSASPTPTPPATPAAPTELSASVVGEDLNFQVKLQWTDNAVDETGFKIERAVVEGDDCSTATFEELLTIDPIPTDTVEYTDGSVSPATTYCYRVLAVNGDIRAASGIVRSEPSNAAQVTTPAVELEVPSDLTATALSEQGIYLTWHYATEAINGFNLERGDADCSIPSFTQIAVLDAGNRNFSDVGLTAATTYCYRIMAFVGPMPLINSAFSETVTATTLEPGATPLPTPSPEPTPTADPNDVDGDGVVNDEDNCPETANPEQGNVDQDDKGDLCDEDADNDGLPNDQDPDSLDDDTDNDGLLDGADNCPTAHNPDQHDNNGNSLGDACDPDDPDADTDGDGIVNASDNCPVISNPEQEDSDGDKIGDACDTSPGTVVKTGGGCAIGARPIHAPMGWLIPALGVLAMLAYRRKQKA
jgi:hypothetical protein